MRGLWQLQNFSVGRVGGSPSSAGGDRDLDLSCSHDKQAVPHWIDVYVEWLGGGGGGGDSPRPAKLDVRLPLGET